MNSRHRIRIIASSICAAALLFASNVPAQTVYKQVDDDGRAVFSDRPPAKSALAPSARRGARQIEANEAARRLKQAQLERKRGIDPQPGELTPGTGKSTVNYRYWRRQEKLRQVVEQAQRRANETQRPQLASQ
jgi:hypothetical protein